MAEKGQHPGLEVAFLTSGRECRPDLRQDLSALGGKGSANRQGGNRVGRVELVQEHPRAHPLDDAERQLEIFAGGRALGGPQQVSHEAVVEESPAREDTRSDVTLDLMIADRFDRIERVKGRL